MAERELPAERHQPPPVPRRLARDLVDRGDGLGLERVLHTERVGEKATPSSAGAEWKARSAAAEKVEEDQQRLEAGDRAAQVDRSLRVGRTGRRRLEHRSDQWRRALQPHR